jgi:TolA protein
VEDLLKITQGNARDFLLWRTCFVTSITLHAIVATLFLSSKLENSGAVPVESTAISINLEMTEVMAAPEQSEQREAAASPAGAPGSVEQQKEEEKVEEKPEPEKAEEKKEEPPPPEPVKTEAKEETPQAAPAETKAEAHAEEVREPDPEPDPELEAAAKAEREAEARAAAKRKEEQQRKVRAEAARKTAERAEARKKKREASRSGATGAKGAHSAKASKAQVSASRGAIRDYGAKVRAKIAANPPSGLSRGGHVVVALSITPSGSLSSASIDQSSGDKTFDQAVLAAVRRSSPFPPPPAGSRPEFTIAFNFR